MSCNCKKNGTTSEPILILNPGSTAANATYLMSVTHYLCGNRKVCANGNFPMSAKLDYQVLGLPTSVGNGAFCCQVLCTGQVMYMPYRNGQNSCGCCENYRYENVYFTMCIPCESATVPTITGGTVIVAPTDLSECKLVTNAVELTTSINVATAQTVNNNG